MSSPRICIKCSSPQEPIVITEVKVDRCVQCGGIWLERGVLHELVKKRSDPESDAQLEAKIAQLSTAEATVGAAPAIADEVVNTPCPACSGKLTIVTFGKTSIEQCSGCDGVFLDRGELARAMKLVDSSEATTIMALAVSVTTQGSIGG